MTPLRCSFLLPLILFVFCSSEVQAQQNYANTTVSNKTGGPFCLQQIADLADLCITGPEASFDANDDLSKGSGYIKAKPDKLFYMVLAVRPSDAHTNDLNVMLIRLWLTRIDFDDNAKATSVIIGKPVMDTSDGTELKLTSTGKVTGTKGNITVSLEGGRKLSFPVNPSLKSSINSADFLLTPKKKDEKK